jgi:hypothetical protein
VAGLFETYLIQQGRELIRYEIDGTGILKGEFTFEERTMEVWVSHSPSERNTHATLADLIRMYEACLRV